MPIHKELGKVRFNTRLSKWFDTKLKNEVKTNHDFKSYRDLIERIISKHFKWKAPTDKELKAMDKLKD